MMCRWQRKHTVDIFGSSDRIASMLAAKERLKYLKQLSALVSLQDSSAACRCHWQLHTMQHLSAELSLMQYS